MRLPVDNAVGSPCSKLIGDKENVEPEVIGPSESSAAANLLWLLDFRLDNLLPNDGNNCAEKMTHNQGNYAIITNSQRTNWRFGFSDLSFSE